MDADVILLRILWLNSIISKPQGANAETIMEEPITSPTQDLSEASHSNAKKSFASIKRVGTLIAERWPDYLLEIVVVIIGITISFALNNFQANSADKILEENYLKGLQQDVQSDIYELRQTLERTKVVITSSEKILEYSRGQKVRPSNDELINLVMAIASRPNFVSKNSTLLSLKSSANLPLIRDAGLEDLLFIYDQQYQGIKTVEFFEGQEVISLVAPFILKNIPLSKDVAATGMDGLSIERIITNVEFINSAVVRREKRRELFQEYSEILETLTQIEAKLKENLTSR